MGGGLAGWLRGGGRWVADLDQLCRSLWDAHNAVGAAWHLAIARDPRLR